MKIGIRLESLGLPLRRALPEAERLGVTGVQVDAVGALAPANLSQSGRREFRHRLQAHNLELTALGCPMRRGLNVPEELDARIDHVRAVMALSFDLGPRLVIVEAGQISEDLDSPGNARLREALLALGQHGDRTGTALALETGLESGTAMRSFLDRLDTGSLKANLDPANLLIHGFDPYASALALRGLIAHVHAKDARQASSSRSAAEVPLGHGDLDWLRLIEHLIEGEYDGWLTVEREAGTQRLADVAAGVAFLRRLVR